MSIAEDALTRLLRLAPDQQEQVLQLIERLEQQQAERAGRQNPYGLWAGFAPDVTEEEFAQARREMWSKLPREDI